MRISESHLRKIVRKEIRKSLISEAMTKAGELKKEDGWRVEISYLDRPGFIVRIKKNDETYGEISTKKTKSKCLNALYVYTVESSKRGLGPLLYDIAIELATEQGKSLTASRESVSMDALSVWEKYADSRSGEFDVGQLDSDPGILTPEDPADDCDYPKMVSMRKSPALSKDYLVSDPLSKTYSSRGTPTLKTLRDAGILVDLRK